MASTPPFVREGYRDVLYNSRGAALYARAAPPMPLARASTCCSIHAASSAWPRSRARSAGVLPERSRVPGSAPAARSARTALSAPASAAARARRQGRTEVSAGAARNSRARVLTPKPARTCGNGCDGPARVVALTNEIGARLEQYLHDVPVSSGGRRGERAVGEAVASVEVDALRDEPCHRGRVTRASALY